MAWLPGFEGGIRRGLYAVAAPAILLTQHLVVTLVSVGLGRPPKLDAEFWLLPLQSLARIPDLPAWAAALPFLVCLAAAGLLAAIAFRRASVSGQGYVLAALAVLPIVQFAALAALALLPLSAGDEPEPPEARANVAAIIQGVLAGVALILIAVLVSASALGAYGWGLFVLTPFVVGMATAYLANRDSVIPIGRSQALVLSAAALGCLMLVAVALEGVVCILLAAPLGLFAALFGGAMGRRLAIARGGGSTPLMCVALLPLVFAIEAAMPPSVVIESSATIDIAAPPSAVWRALTAGDDIGPEPGLAFRLGLAYPLRSRLLGTHIGADRIGIFSTGIARERVTAWEPGRILAFAVLTQPPAMAELSPYANVHAPHVRGYFETISTRFTLHPLPGGGTRLVADSDHVLRLDPVLYWEPVARWAIGQNVDRVLQDVRVRSESADGG